MKTTDTVTINFFSLTAMPLVRNARPVRLQDAGSALIASLIEDELNPLRTSQTATVLTFDSVL